MKFEREELHWPDNTKFRLVRYKFGEIMPRDRFVQIKLYLRFSDDTGDKIKATNYTKLDSFLINTGTNVIDSFLINTGTNVKVNTYHTEKLV